MKIHWPKITIPKEYESAESYLKHLVYEGARKKGYIEGENNYLNERIEAIEHELDCLRGYEPYFIIFYDLMKFCKTENIIVAPGYGNAPSSVVNYCLDITKIEPACDFQFESFFIKGTTRIPDIDILVEDQKRGSVIKYLSDTYGEESVLMSGVGYKANLKEKRSYRVPVYGVHACGVCLFDRPYHEVTETIDIVDKDSGKSTKVPKLTKEELEHLGYVHIDIIGSKDLNLVSKILQLIEIKHGTRIDFDSIPLDDSETYKFLSSGNEDVGKIWHCGDGIAKDFADTQPSWIVELCAINSMWTHKLYKWKNYYKFLVEEDDADDRYSLFYEIFYEMTRGLVFYHEQINLILYLMSGLSLEDCERIRRNMRCPDQKPIRKCFMDGVKRSGLHSIKEAKNIWMYFMKHHKETISMSHYYSLAVRWYRTTWLRVHYPDEFKACFI
jgi:DNA polymerase-3 subunit alpha